MNWSQVRAKTFLAKYWLETMIGAIALIVLLVGIMVSQTGPRSSASAPVTTAEAPETSTALAVLPGKPLLSVDALFHDGLRQPFKYSDDELLLLTSGQSLQFRGWVVDNVAHTAPYAAYVQVDDFARVKAVMSNRHDVAVNLAVPEYEMSGYDVSIPARILTPGTHRLAFLIEDAARTGYRVNPTWFRVLVRPSAVATAKRPTRATGYELDAIIVGGKQMGSAEKKPALVSVKAGQAVTLEGWALDAEGNGLASGVTAVVDGARLVPGTYGMRRSDVAKFFGDDSLSPSGFSVTLPPGTLRKGTHDVSLRILSKDGSGYYLVSDRVKITVD